MDFEKEIVDSELPVVVDFYATWCGPCKMMAPNVERLAKEYAEKIKVMKVDVDQDPVFAESLNINTIPTIVIFRKGEVVASHVGAMPYELLEHFVKNNAF